MSEANKATLRRANAAITDGDHEGFLHCCTDDTKWTFVGDRTIEGKEGVRQWMKATYREPPKFNVKDLIAEGEFVAAVGEITVKDANGRAVSWSYCDVWRFRGSQMAELRAYVIPLPTR